MADIKKVIIGLEHCADRRFCNDFCPYSDIIRDQNRGMDECVSALAKDALELLKEQEARVMTLDEVKAFDWDYCYLEEERLTGKEYRAVCGDYALICITWPCIASMRIQHGDDSYGRKWRCWSAKPTDEQRQAVKWE